PGNTVAFFEYTGQHLDTFAKPAGVPYEKAAQFDHLSLHLPDEDALLRLRDRLKSHGCEVTDVIDHSFLRSIYFSDNNGIALEASCWTLDPTGRPVDYGDERLFSDPDPVPAFRELRDTGQLDHTVETRLVEGITKDIYQPGRG
ncbi:MAG: VOC family protein, partial [Nocardioidaceae bacterium]